MQSSTPDGNYVTACGAVATITDQRRVSWAQKKAFCGTTGTGRLGKITNDPCSQLHAKASARTVRAAIKRRMRKRAYDIEVLEVGDTSNTG